MHIREVTIENIRRFGSGDSRLHLTLPDKGWIVVAGPNGSGKTTFLKILALGISRSFSHEYADTLNSWVRQGERVATSRTMLVPTVDDRFDPEDHTGDLSVRDEWVFENRSQAYRRDSDNDRAFAGPWHDNPRGWFAAGYGAYRSILPGTNIPEGWSSATTRESAFLTLFKEAAMLGHPIRWLMDLKFRSMDSRDMGERARAAKLGEHVVAILNTGLLGKVKVLGANSSGLSVDDGGITLSITKLGSGFQTLAGIVIDMIRHIHARFGELCVTYDDSGAPRVENSGVVLIDEVEQHLHPAWQRRIGFWFKKHFPNIQFIVTTHSPFVCQAATEKGLIVLSGEAAEPAKVTDEKLYQEVVNGSVDDALLSDLFGLDRTWSDEAEARRSHLADLETNVLTGEATEDEHSEYQRLRQQMPQTMSDEVNRIAARFLRDLDPSR